MFNLIDVDWIQTNKHPNRQATETKIDVKMRILFLLTCQYFIFFREMFRRSIYSLGRLTQKQLSFGVQEFRDLYSAESVRSTEFRHVSTKSAKRTELKNVPATESNLEVDRFSQILEEISRQERFSHFKRYKYTYNADFV